MEVDVRNLHALDDGELSQLARLQRRRALEGDRAAYGVAHELEKELRRRGVAFTRPAALPEPNQAEPRPWWRFWH
jgi:anti-sigma factor RsiW